MNFKSYLLYKPYFCIVFIYVPLLFFPHYMGDASIYIVSLVTTGYYLMHTHLHQLLGKITGQGFFVNLSEFTQGEMVNKLFERYTKGKTEYYY